MSLRQATVEVIVGSHPDLQIALVSVSALDRKLLAYNYLSLGGPIAEGQQVLVNTTGVELGLGTGGTVFVVPCDPYDDNNVFGHLIKARYTPLQVVVDTCEEQDSPYHEVLREAKSIEGMPVVCCELHSQVPLVAAAIKQRSPETRVAFVMDDSAALPLAFSELIRQSNKAGLIDVTISSGQAFGGQYEAVNLYSALLIAHLVNKADIAVVAPGPGIAGTGTFFGHSGIAQGEALNAVTVLGGTPIAALRLSWQDTRPRHQGLSHHSQTVLEQICLTPVSAPIPGNLPYCKGEQLQPILARLQREKRHYFPLVEASFLDIDLRGVPVTTMGRTRSEDPEFFSAAFAAGIFAAQALGTRKDDAQ